MQTDKEYEQDGFAGVLAIFAFCLLTPVWLPLVWLVSKLMFMAMKFMFEVVFVVAGWMGI
jgi:hypothetical protein